MINSFLGHLLCDCSYRNLIRHWEQHPGLVSRTCKFWKVKQPLQFINSGCIFSLHLKLAQMRHRLISMDKATVISINLSLVTVTDIKNLILIQRFLQESTVLMQSILHSCEQDLLICIFLDQNCLIYYKCCDKTYFIPLVFLYPLESLEDLWFYVFKGYRKEPVAWNRFRPFYIVQWNHLHNSKWGQKMASNSWHWERMHAYYLGYQAKVCKTYFNPFFQSKLPFILIL